jgi:hypothetical protein
MARPVIALLTDFGMRDHYAGTMKGVMLAIALTSLPWTFPTTSPPSRSSARLEPRGRLSLFPRRHDLPRGR